MMPESFHYDQTLSDPTLNPTNALVPWRPFFSQAGTTNLFAVTIADNGTPGLSATNNFTVTVNPLSSQPSFDQSFPPPGNC